MANDAMLVLSMPGGGFDRSLRSQAALDAERAIRRLDPEAFERALDALGAELDGTLGLCLFSEACRFFPPPAGARPPGCPVEMPLAVLARWPGLARAKDENGATALMGAALRARPDVMAALLPLSDPAAMDQWGRDLLVCAAQGGDAECVRLALPRGDPSIRVAVLGWRNALALAATSDSTDPEALGMLLANSDLAQLDGSGFDALSACAAGKFVQTRSARLRAIVEALPAEGLARRVALAKSAALSRADEACADEIEALHRERVGREIAAEVAAIRGEAPGLEEAPRRPPPRI